MVGRLLFAATVKGMRLHILSDLHLEFQPFQPPPTAADVVILAGDIHVGHQGIRWAEERFPDTPVIYVLGNHEYYGRALPKHIEVLRDYARGTHVLLLENGVAEIGGVIFLGCTLWTDFLVSGDRVADMEVARRRISDYRKILMGSQFRSLDPLDTVRWHEQSVAWLHRQFRRFRHQPVVVVTHHAPSARSLQAECRPEVLASAYASDLDYLVVESGARLWVHGHLHGSSAYKLGDTRVVCNPRGYPSGYNPQFQADFLLEDL